MGERGTGLIRFDVVEIDRSTPHPVRGNDDHPGPGWYWRVRATNGLTLAHSEVYEELAGARKGIRALVSGIRGETGSGVEVVTIPLDGRETKSRL